ncbi:transmembrane protein 272-like [Tubulanus polymorphus]|uniref:transmembrane protein 272-like n=1 Tax=Tubulanus polymorphus TaxID=672921 RepID=UPI003DA2690D
MSAYIRSVIVDLLAGIGKTCFPRAINTENKSVQTCFYAVIVAFIFFSSLPISMLVIGAQYIDQCPGERMIPIYLLVRGSLEIILLVYVCINLIICKMEKLHVGTLSRCCVFTFATLIILLLIIWLFTGIYWINRSTINHDDQTSYTYCHATVYRFASWITYGSLIFVSLLIIIACVGCFCCHKNAGIDRPKEKHHPQRNVEYIVGNVEKQANPPPSDI